jgi:hypothetical protein
VDDSSDRLRRLGYLGLFAAEVPRLQPIAELHPDAGVFAAVAGPQEQDGSEVASAPAPIDISEASVHVHAKERLRVNSDQQHSRASSISIYEREGTRTGSIDLASNGGVADRSPRKIASHNAESDSQIGLAGMNQRYGTPGDGNIATHIDQKSGSVASLPAEMPRVGTTSFDTARGHGGTASFPMSGMTSRAALKEAGSYGAKGNGDASAGPSGYHSGVVRSMGRQPSQAGPRTLK